MDFLKPHYDTEGPFGLPMNDAQAQALEAIIKTLPQPAEPKFVTLDKAPSELLPGERADVSWISTEDVDRDQEIVVAKGMDDSHFKLNPIVTLQHCYSLPPVGKSIWRKRIKDGELVGVKAKTQYPKRPDGWKDEEWPPDTTFSLIQSGLLMGKSIGFLPTKSHAPTDDEIKKNADLQDVRRIIDEWLLLEYACVYIPCQQNAVVEAVSKGVRIPDDFILNERVSCGDSWVAQEYECSFEARHDLRRPSWSAGRRHRLRIPQSVAAIEFAHPQMNLGSYSTSCFFRKLRNSSW